jgi:hypothetical protein
MDAVRDLTRQASPIAMMTIDFGGFKVPFGAMYKGETSGFVPIDIRSELAKWAPAPDRVMGTAKALTLPSFIDMANRHKSEHSAVFAAIVNDVPGKPWAPSLTAVIDYIGLAHQPSFCRHRIVYNWPTSREWLDWIGMHGQSMSQATFAEFLEVHLADLATPTPDEEDFFEGMMITKFGAPNQIAQLSRGLAIRVESSVAEAVVLQSGEGSIRWDETHKDADGKPLKIPGLFMLSIPLFEGGAMVRIPCRLRYRKSGNSLMWSYQVYRPEHFVRTALQDDLRTVADLTLLPVFEGAPEA